MSFLGGLLHLVEGAGPEAMADGFVSILDKALVKEERPRVASMDRGGLTAALKDRSNAAEVKHRFGAGEEFAPGAEGGQKPGAVGGATARQSGQERVIGVLRESGGDLAQLVNRRLRPTFRSIWFVGGGVVSGECLRLGLADEVRYSILPILIGDGIPFFEKLDKDVALHLAEVKAYKSGMVALRYEVRGHGSESQNAAI